MSEPDPPDEKPDRLDPYADEDPRSYPMPIGLHGPVNAEVDTRPIAPPSPETFVCLRDCRYYMQITTPGEFMEIPGLPPTPAVLRFCTYVSQDVTELTDRTVTDCNKWSPLSKDEIEYAEKFREDYRARTAHKEPK